MASSISTAEQAMTTATTRTKHEDDEDTAAAKELEDPSLSSASLCIEFQMMGETFRPVFTHQAFPGEYIRGYHPPSKRLLEHTRKRADGDDNHNDTLLHSSHKNHELATKELSIDIELAPSAESCQVNIAIEKKRLPRRQSSRASKRPRLITKGESQSEEEEALEHDNKSFDEEEPIGSSSPSEQSLGNDDNSDSEFEDDEGGISEEEEQDNDREGATRRRRMPTKEILSNLKQGLPMVQNEPVNKNYLRRPMGVPLKQFSVGGKDFCLSLATGTDVAKYHHEVQRLALWFIETADGVDVASLEGGFWRVLYLFQKHEKTRYSLAGYITLFHFHAPFKKPKPGYVVRICQALVLPPYQRSGHGRQLLTCVFDLAHGKYHDKLIAHEKKGDEIVEINVESPAPAFVLLRNRVDYECFLRSVEQHEPWVPSLADPQGRSLMDPDYFTSVPESEVIQAAAVAKITPRQIHIVQELYKLGQLQEHLAIQSHNTADNELLEKRFRLMVKKRLNKEHSEDLSGLRTKAEKQTFLENAFQKCLESYRVTIPKNA